jgi:hypothetical protein
MRRVLDAYPDRVLIGEIYLPLERLVAYYGHEEMGGAHLPFNFQLLQTPWNARMVDAAINEYEAALPGQGWPNWVLGNHDKPRIAARVGSAQARVAAMLLLTLRGYADAVLRRRDRHRASNRSARRRAGPLGTQRAGIGLWPRSRAHPDAVGWIEERGLHNREPLASSRARRRVLQHRRFGKGRTLHPESLSAPDCAPPQRARSQPGQLQRASF